MKIVASDFDHTLFFPEKVFADNSKNIASTDLAAIAKWRARGNLFGIITGRSYSMLMQRIKTISLHCDFIICLTGAVSYDENGKIISQKSIDNADTRFIISMPIMQRSRHIACFTAYNEYVCVQSECSWFNNMQGKEEFVQIDSFMAQCLKGVCQISLQYADNVEAAQAAAEINSLSTALCAYQNNEAVDIVRSDVDKATSLLQFLTANNWTGDNVYTIGDGDNDLSMIKRFSGFTLDSAGKNIKEQANKVYISVGQMLMEHI